MPGRGLQSGPELEGRQRPTCSLGRLGSTAELRDQVLPGRPAAAGQVARTCGITSAAINST